MAFPPAWGWVAVFWAFRERCDEGEWGEDGGGADAGDAAVLRGESGAPGLPDVLPDRRFLRAVLRGCDHRLARTATDADRARPREETADVRGAVSRGRSIHPAAAAEGLPDRAVRSDGRPQADQEDCAARGDSRADSGDGGGFGVGGRTEQLAGECEREGLGRGGLRGAGAAGS